MPVGEPAARVLEHLSTGGLAAPEELFWDVRRLLETLAADRPVVLYLDDLQWAEPMLLDLLDHVAELSRGAPILLLCTARPELLDARPGWGGGKLTATTTLLEPLVVKEAEALLEELGDGLDQETRVRVIKASEGNPLFLEEMVALARERGTVEVPSDDPSAAGLATGALRRGGAGGARARRGRGRGVSPPGHQGAGGRAAGGGGGAAPDWACAQGADPPAPRNA